MEPNDTPAPAGLIHASALGAVRLIVLRLPQALDSKDFDQLNATLRAELEASAGGPVVVDLAAVEYMGSSVLGLMVNARTRVKAAGGRLVLCGLSAWLVQTFRACSLEKLFVTAATRDDAVLAARQR